MKYKIELHEQSAESSGLMPTGTLLNLTLQMGEMTFRSTNLFENEDQRYYYLGKLFRDMGEELMNRSQN